MRSLLELPARLGTLSNKEATTMRERRAALSSSFASPFTESPGPPTPPHQCLSRLKDLPFKLPNHHACIVMLVLYLSAGPLAINVSPSALSVQTYKPVGSVPHRSICLSKVTHLAGTYTYWDRACCSCNRHPPLATTTWKLTRRAKSSEDNYLAEMKGWVGNLQETIQTRPQKHAEMPAWPIQ